MPATLRRPRSVRLTAVDGDVSLAETAPGRQPPDARPIRGGRWPAILAATALLVAGVASGWAGRSLLAPPEPLPESAAFAVMTAESGAVERAIALNARAAWGGGVTVANNASGTITRVRVSGARSVKVGEAVYDVNLVPVYLAKGAVPAFRTLSRGINGADVQQLQEMLRTVGVRERAADGRFGPQTVREVAEWQRSIDRPATGQVALGALLFVPELPATVTLEGLTVGAVVAPGSPPSVNDGTEEAATGSGSSGVRVLPAAPTFSIALPENQATLVRSGMRVGLQHGTVSWEAEVTSVDAPTTDGTAVARLGPLAGVVSICGDQCRQIPIAGDSGIRAIISLVPKTAGVVVPSTALVVADSGTGAVVAEDGTRIPVTVRASTGGRVVVEGIKAGQKVRVPGDAGR